MTHYTVLVIGENVEKKLEPYDENLEVEPYIRYTYGEMIKEKRNLTMKDIAYRKHYLDMDIKNFARDWHGMKIDSEGNALSTYNPKSKWDWYSIGGRWQGMLKLKPKLKYPDRVLKGNKSFMDNTEYKEGTCDQACFVDIDWKTIEKEQKDKLIETWKKAVAICEPTNTHEEYEVKYHKHIIDVYKTQKNYLKEHTIGFKTYSVITDNGEWHSPGDMGWWGFSSETDEEKKSWDIQYKKMFLTGLAPNTLLTIVDCHI